MKNIEFNNIEENKFVMGYIHYKNNRNKTVYKKAIGYIVPEENLIFSISSYNLGEVDIEKITYEKSEENNNLYCSYENNEIFELKRYIYPKSNKKISFNTLMEIIPLLEKYILDENFEPNEKLKNEYKNDTDKKLKTEIKQLMLRRNVANL